MWHHFTARTFAPHEPLRDFASARWLWNRLRAHFGEEMLAAVLMPNHLHLILPQALAASHHARSLSNLLGAFSKHLGQRKLWQPTPPPTQIPNQKHLWRQIRYVALNPCRDGLCKDPLAWNWSTYRDLMGATIEPTPSSERLAKILGDQRPQFKVRLHAYVSADPTVKVEGTPAPQAALPTKFAVHSIQEILNAAAASLQMLPQEIENNQSLRALSIHLAERHGWRQTPLLANIGQMSIRQVQRIRQNAPPPGIKAADLCLGDRRLQQMGMHGAKNDVFRL